LLLPCTKAPGKGTGLGLAQVYGFARQSEGTVKSASTRGQGTTITLYLPRSATSPPPKREQTDHVFPQGECETILLVEDNAEVANLSTALLKEFGYQVKLAENVDEALSLITNGEAIDLVFSDIVLPGCLNGLDLARDLRRRFPQIPVLLTTGYSTEGRNVLQEGFAILPKPYKPHLLHRAIRDLLA
jgi:two-component system, NtrC family, sensor kinase